MFWGWSVGGAIAPPSLKIPISWEMGCQAPGPKTDSPVGGACYGHALHSKRHPPPVVGKKPASDLRWVHKGSQK